HLEPFRYDHYSYGPETERPFATFTLQAALVKLLTPAGPPPWTLPPVEGPVAPAGARSAAEVVLDLAPVVHYGAGQGTVPVDKGGELGTPAQRALARAVPLPVDADFPLPDAAGFFFEMLRRLGLVTTAGGQAHADRTAARRQLGQPAAVQAHAWARA